MDIYKNDKNKTKQTHKRMYKHFEAFWQSQFLNAVKEQIFSANSPCMNTF